MARLPRLSVAGLPHLVLQRAHGRQPFALDDDDRRNYLHALGEAALAQGVDIHGYALTDTEVLLLGTPKSDDSLGRMMQALGRRYVNAFNRRHGRAGTLWEGRFRNTILEGEHFFLACLRHVELAPQHAGLTLDPATYRWSSAGHHVGRHRDPLIRDHPVYWTLGNTPFEREHAYRMWLEQGESDTERTRLRVSASQGWALGSDPFIAALATTAGRPTRPRARGRPRKSVPI